MIGDYILKGDYNNPRMSIPDENEPEFMKIVGVLPTISYFFMVPP